MHDQTFPTDYYLNTLVRVLDTIKYQDNNYDHHERVKKLHYAYSEAAKHFAQPLQQNTLQVNPKKFEVALRTGVIFVVYSFAKLPLEVTADLTILWVFYVLLDDSINDPHLEMASFYKDLIHGRQQKHPWWRSMNDYMPKVLNHYGSFCSLSIVRSTIDFFQGNWVEQYNFQGYPGSGDFPPFLRRLNGLGQAVGAILFPVEQFDEQAVFADITTAIAQVEHLNLYVNDLISFYKEFDDLRDQTSLVNNYCRVEGISLDQALDKLTCDVVRCCEQLAVFEGRDANVKAAVDAFVHGYVTFHFCDPRYRMKEFYERCGDGPVALKFRHYYEEARRVGYIDPGEWAIPPVAVTPE